MKNKQTTLQGFRYSLNYLLVIIQDMENVNDILERKEHVLRLRTFIRAMLEDIDKYKNLDK